MQKLIERKECTTEPVKAERWVLVYFTKDGRSMRDDIEFDTVGACEAEGKGVMQDAQTTRANSSLWIGDEPFCYVRELSHFIPMPIPTQ